MQRLMRKAFLLPGGGKTGCTDAHSIMLGELPWSACAAMVRDWFGVKWFLSLPQHRPEEGWTPEEET